MDKMIPVIGVPRPPQNLMTIKPAEEKQTPKKPTEEKIISEKESEILSMQSPEFLLKLQTNIDKVVAASEGKLVSFTVTTTLFTPALNEELKRTNTSREDRIAMEDFVTAQARTLDIDGWAKGPNRRQKTALRVLWLTNKKVLRPKTETTSSKVAKAVKPPVKKQQPTVEKNPKNKKSKKKNMNEENNAKTSNQSESNSYSDLDVKSNEDFADDAFLDNRVGPSTSFSSGSGGYQYLDDNWINSDKPWRHFQTAPAPTSSEMLSYSMPSYGNSLQFGYPTPLPTSVPFTSSSMMQEPSYPSFQQLSPTQLRLNPLLVPFDTPPPAIHQPLYDPPTGESLYRQAFPIQDQKPQLPMNPTQFSTASLEPTVEALEMSEAELARQKRLMEIEEELQMIDVKKRQMQMEAEVREREMELAYRQQMVELRAREMRDREMYEQGRISSERERELSSRHHYEDRGYYSGRYDNYSPSAHHQDSYRSYEYDHRNSSPYREINIERMDDSARRHGSSREDGRHLKRSADQNRHQQSNRRSGNHKPVKIMKRRHGRSNNHEDLQMQEISDDEH